MTNCTPCMGSPCKAHLPHCWVCLRVTLSNLISTKRWRSCSVYVLFPRPFIWMQYYLLSGDRISLVCEPLKENPSVEHALNWRKNCLWVSRRYSLFSWILLYLQTVSFRTSAEVDPSCYFQTTYPILLEQGKICISL